MIPGSFYRGCKEGLHLFGANLSLLINTLLLSFVYVIGVGLASLLGRRANKGFLDIRISAKEKTYWQDLRLSKKEMDEYYRQF